MEGIFEPSIVSVLEPEYSSSQLVESKLFSHRTVSNAPLPQDHGIRR